MTETIDTAQPEALRLADELDEEAGRITQYTNRPGDLLRELAATELRRLHSAQPLTDGSDGVPLP